jgi:hypothetical protein
LVYYRKESDGNGVSPEPKKPKSVVSLDGGTHRVLYFSVEVTAGRPVAEPSVPWVCLGGVVFYDFFLQKINFIRNIHHSQYSYHSFYSIPHLNSQFKKMK